MSKIINVNIIIAFLLSLGVYITSCSDLFFYDGKRIVEITLILIMLTTLSISKYAQKILLDIFFTRKNTFLSLSILGLGLISASLSPAPKQALIEIITLFSLFLLVIQVAPVWRKHPKIIPLLCVALLCSFVVLEIKFISYYVAFILSSDAFDLHHFFFTYAHPRFFNQYQVWTLPLVTIALLIDHPLLKEGYVRKLLWSIAILWWLILFASNGRGILVAVAGGAIFTFIVFREKAKEFLQYTSILFILGLICFLFFFNLLPSLSDSSLTVQSYYIRTTSSGRLTYLWPMAIQYIIDNPWFGIGPMHYAWYPNKVAAHPHDSLLQIASEWGLPVLLIILFLLYQTCRQWVLRFNKNTLIEYDKNHSLAIIALTFSISSAAIYSIFSGIIVMPMSHMMGVLTLSLALAVFQTKRNESHSITLKHYWLISLSFAMLTIMYFWLLSPELIPRLADQSFLSDIHRDVNGPRFWLAGDISH